MAKQKTVHFTSAQKFLSVCCTPHHGKRCELSLAVNTGEKYGINRTVFRVHHGGSVAQLTKALITLLIQVWTILTLQSVDHICYTRFSACLVLTLK